MELQQILLNILEKNPLFFEVYLENTHKADVGMLLIRTQCYHLGFLLASTSAVISI